MPAGRRLKAFLSKAYFYGREVAAGLPNPVRTGHNNSCETLTVICFGGPAFSAVRERAGAPIAKR